MSASEGYVPVRDRLGGARGMLRLDPVRGWIYYAPEAMLRTDPIGDPLRVRVLDADVVQRHFGANAAFDGFEVTL